MMNSKTLSQSSHFPQKAPSLNIYAGSSVQDYQSYPSSLEFPENPEENGGAMPHSHNQRSSSNLNMAFYHFSQPQQGDMSLHHSFGMAPVENSHPYTDVGNSGPILHHFNQRLPSSEYPPGHPLYGQEDVKRNVAGPSTTKATAKRTAQNTEFNIRQYTGSSPILDCDQNNPAYQELLSGRFPSLETWKDIIQAQIRGDKKTADIEKLLCSRSRFNDINQELNVPGSTNKPATWPGKLEAWKNHVKSNYVLSEELSRGYHFENIAFDGPRISHKVKTTKKNETHTPLEDSFNIISAAHFEGTIITKNGQLDTKHYGRDATFKRIKQVSDSIPKKWVVAFVYACPHPACVNNRKKGEDTKAMGTKGGPGSKRKVDEMSDENVVQFASQSISFAKKSKKMHVSEPQKSQPHHLLHPQNGYAANEGMMPWQENIQNPLDSNKSMPVENFGRSNAFKAPQPFRVDQATAYGEKIGWKDNLLPIDQVDNEPESNHGNEENQIIYSSSPTVADYYHQHHNVAEQQENFFPGGQVDNEAESNHVDEEIVYTYPSPSVVPYSDLTIAGQQHGSTSSQMDQVVDPGASSQAHDETLSRNPREAELDVFSWLTDLFWDD